MNNRIGEMNFNNFGSRMVIVEYRNALDITVKFDNGYSCKAQYGDFKKGAVKSPYDKSVYGVGFIGEGVYKANKNGKNTKIYTTWNSMIGRCYDPKSLAKYPTYIGCEVCEEWQNFQVFAEWYEKNYYEFDEELNLDKDYLVNGNKIYSSETCVFLPKSINSALTNGKSTNSTGFTGVYWNKNANKYQAQIVKFGKRYYLGLFDNPEGASLVYEVHRVEYLAELIESYKFKLPKSIYELLLNKLLLESDSYYGIVA